METIPLKNTTTTSPDNHDLIVAKVVSMVVLGFASFTIGLIPVKLATLTHMRTINGDKNLLLSLLLCFGGGVLLFTTFIHLQPEVREYFDMLEQHNKLPNMGSGFPISEVVFCLGFFFVYLVEELVHMFLHKKVHDSALHRSLSMRCSSRRAENMTIPRVTLTKSEDGQISYISNSNKELLDSQTTINIEKVNGGGHSHHTLDENLKNSFSGFLAVLALSFHAVFEGLAVGLESNVQKVWYLFAAIATHKLVIAFCVGVELVTSKTKMMLVALYMGTFAIVTPLGIGIGIILRETEGDQEDITCVVLQGMAAGTLLYVVFFEVLSRERGNRHSGIYQLLAIISGFLIMFALQAMTGHEHSHGNNGEDHHHHHHEEHSEVSTHHHN